MTWRWGCCLPSAHAPRKDSSGRPQARVYFFLARSRMPGCLRAANPSGFLMFTSQRGGWTNSSTKLASFKAGVKMHEVFSFKEFEMCYGTTAWKSPCRRSAERAGRWKMSRSCRAERIMASSQTLRAQSESRLPAGRASMVAHQGDCKQDQRSLKTLHHPITGADRNQT